VRQDIAPASTEPQVRWHQKVSAMVFVVFCVELGLFLLIFPWSGYWETNYFSSSPYWDNAYVRGAVSGLGVVNLLISLVEISRLRSRGFRP
jgi:hypothetical protein